MASERVGILGGTFDPPHVGHLVAAVNAAHHCQLDRVLFMVANVPWQKVGDRSVTAVTHRLGMTEAAVAGRAGLEVSTLEIDLGGDSVTATTLEALQAAEPDTEYMVIVGTDAAAGLNTWRRHETLSRIAEFAVVGRPGSAEAPVPDGFRFKRVPCPLMDISSTEIRERAGSGLPLDYLVPDAVGHYIAAHQLYPQPRTSP